MNPLAMRVMAATNTTVSVVASSVSLMNPSAINLIAPGSKHASSSTTILISRRQSHDLCSCCYCQRSHRWHSTYYPESHHLCQTPWGDAPAVYCLARLACTRWLACAWLARPSLALEPGHGAGAHHPYRLALPKRHEAPRLNKARD